MKKPVTVPENHGQVMIYGENDAQWKADVVLRDVGPTQLLIWNGREEVYVSIL
jgi:hypothetical protein